MPLIRKFSDFFKKRKKDTFFEDEKLLEDLCELIDSYYIGLIDDSDVYHKEVHQSTIFTSGPSLWLTFRFEIDHDEWYMMPGIKKEEWSARLSKEAGRSYSKLLIDYPNLDSEIMTDTRTSLFEISVIITVKHEGNN